MESIGKANFLDPKIVRHLMRYLLSTSGAVRVPESCADRRVMEKMANFRRQQVGNRAALAMRPHKVISVDGSIDWRAGVYHVTFEDGEANKIERRPSGDVAPIDAGYQIDQGSWSVRNNHDDFGAQLAYEGAEVLVHGLLRLRYRALQGRRS